MIGVRPVIDNRADRARRLKLEVHLVARGCRHERIAVAEELLALRTGEVAAGRVAHPEVESPPVL